SDNSYELYKYLEKQTGDNLELIWVFSNICTEYNKKMQEGLPDKRYYINSIKGFYHLLTSKYYVSTHAIPNFYKNFLLNKHIIINLWHGMPIKTLGLVEKNIPKQYMDAYTLLGKFSYFFVTSDIFKLLMQPCFLMHPDKVFITGQPRTDCIFDTCNKERINNFINFDNYKKVILYTPTYKEVLRCNEKREIETEFDNIFYMDDYKQERFFEFIEKENILFILKPHPFDERHYREYMQNNQFKHPNFKVLYNQDFTEENIYLYELFSYVDLMITDFSSISIDFMITKKPVIFLDNLTSQYNNNRGMVLEDNFEILMPGFKAKNYDELEKSIIDSLTIDSYKENRLKALPLLHKYFDSNASERIYEIMKKL
ncbi:MAG: CDP-glycerol glycerophosphotransferase family protein, partial [Candidatus Aenigmarchaeota archaeon]|nr:CDP-glycerol glycerophosphotransferase family protein [Candidatus Aenigmarchaeota archaeon]